MQKQREVQWMKKTVRILSNLTGLILLLMIALLAFIVISSKASGGNPKLFGYELKAVLSGSMEPTFQTGSIIAIKPTTDGSSYQVGDIITFQEKDQKLITHRIIDKNEVNGKVLYTTKGDNNDAADVNPVLSQNVIGKYHNFTLPYIGFVINFANSKAGSALLLIIPGVVLFLSSMISIFSAIREIDKRNREKYPDTSQFH